MPDVDVLADYLSDSLQELLDVARQSEKAAVAERAG
jgi:hypothetical protein